MISESLGTGEQVIAIVRKEGEMPKPDDIQCRAVDNDERCPNKINFDEDTDTWSVFCNQHRVQDEEARQSGEPRVLRFDRMPDESEPLEDDDGPG